MKYRRTGLMAVGALFLFGCSSSSSGEGASGRSEAATSRAEGSSTTTTSRTSNAGSTTLTTKPPSARVSAREALDLLTVLAPVVPIPEDARPCVAEGVAKDRELAAQLKADGAKGSAPDGVMDLGAACMRELRALPAFLGGLEEQVAGGLSAKQRACVEEGYRALDPEVLDAAVADALGAERGGKAAGEIKSMLRGCGVRVGG